jgi:uncharacterized membrane protein YjgN (DUF898 family)
MTQNNNTPPNTLSDGKAENLETMADWNRGDANNRQKGADPFPAGIKSDCWKPLVGFGGRGLDLFGLFVANFFLSIITLGIYAFWGKVKVRKYFWQCTSVFGESLEYTGTGKELFLGFMIVLPLFILFYLAMSLLLEMLALCGILLWLIIFVCIWQYVSYRALRYRLTRTRWRGIRGNLTGKPSDYALKSTCYILLMIFSLGLLIPFSLNLMISHKINEACFGNRRVVFIGTAASLYRAIALPMIGFLLCCLGVIYSWVQIYDFLFRYSELSSYDPIFKFSLLSIEKICSSLLGLSGMFIFYCLIKARFTRWLFQNIQFGEMRCRSTLSTGRLIFVHLTNYLLVVFTLGIGFAWATLRMYSTILNSIDCAGDPKLEELFQDTGTAPRFGEGMLEALDVDVAF